VRDGADPDHALMPDAPVAALLKLFASVRRRFSRQGMVTPTSFRTSSPLSLQKQALQNLPAPVSSKAAAKFAF
jgi:hypothetical protein